MSFGKLLYKINPETRKIIRKLETTKKKIVKRQWSNIFIKKCLDVKVQPKHYNIKHRDKVVQKSFNFSSYKNLMTTYIFIYIYMFKFIILMI